MKIIYIALALAILFAYVAAGDENPVVQGEEAHQNCWRYENVIDGTEVREVFVGYTEGEPSLQNVSEPVEGQFERRTQCYHFGDVWCEPDDLHRFDDHWCSTTCCGLVVQEVFLDNCNRFCHCGNLVRCLEKDFQVYHTVEKEAPTLIPHFCEIEFPRNIETRVPVNCTALDFVSCCQFVKIKTVSYSVQPAGPLELLQYVDDVPPNANYCQNNNADLGSFNNQNLCSTSQSTSIVFVIDVQFPVSATTQIDLRLGTDFGDGGIVLLNNVCIDAWAYGPDSTNWWNGDWNHPAAKHYTRILDPGCYRLQIVGAEPCCDGIQTYQIQIGNDGIWRDLKASNLLGLNHYLSWKPKPDWASIPGFLQWCKDNCYPANLASCESVCESCDEVAPQIPCNLQQSVEGTGPWVPTDIFAQIAGAQAWCTANCIPGNEVACKTLCKQS